MSENNKAIRVCENCNTMIFIDDMTDKEKVFVCDVCGTINSSIPKNMRKADIFFTRPDVLVNKEKLQEGVLQVVPPLEADEIQAIELLMERCWSLKFKATEYEQ